MRSARGFTVVELLVTMVLMGLVVSAVLRALGAQRRFYARQARILDARHALRASTAILGSELRDISALDGDLYAVGPDSVALRSTVGFGVVCQVDAGAGVLALTHVSGHLRLTGGDSLLVFAEGGVRDDDDAWIVLPITGISASGLSCASGEAPQRVLSTGGSLAGVWVGSPIRLFRPYAYRLYQAPDGRWWLGRRLRSDPDYLPVAGPLAPPAESGLLLSYYDGSGQPTADAARVRRVQIDVRAPTFRALDDPDYRSLSTSVFLRSGG